MFVQTTPSSTHTAAGSHFFFYFCLSFLGLCSVNGKCCQRVALTAVQLGTPRRRRLSGLHQLRFVERRQRHNRCRPFAQRFLPFAVAIFGVKVQPHRLRRLLIYL